VSAAPHPAIARGAELGAAWRALVDGMSAFAEGFAAAVNGFSVRQSDVLAPGTAFVADGAIFMPTRDAIRMKYPRGLQGDIDASIEWQKLLIDRAADAAMRHLDEMYAETTNREVGGRDA
jgi:hypothetical protein